MKQSLVIQLSQYSDKGLKEHNEDAYGAKIPTDDALDNKGIAIAIADGMSGSEGAKEASEICIKQFMSDYYSTPESWTASHSVNQVMSSLNTFLVSQGQKRFTSTHALVTTFSALILKSQTAHIFHVGDTRVYRLRKNTLIQLTNDHCIWLSKDKQYLSRAVGIDTHLEIDYHRYEIKVGDIFLLTTDGIHDFLNDQVIQGTLLHSVDNLDHACLQLIKQAKAANSNDNLTCQALKIESVCQANKQEFYEKLTQLPFPPDLKSGQRIDGYVIVRTLSETPRSQVYLAKDSLSEEKNYVVLKTPSVNYEDDPAYLDRFLHEEWVAKRLNSIHLMKTYSQRKRRFLYSTLEYVAGPTLQQCILDHPQRSLTQVRQIVTQIASGLRSMHRMEMIHQDIKPNNIIVNENDTMVIIDFGSTKVAGLAELQTVIKHNSIVGTANYSAPEYFKGLQGTTRSDIYSLGVVAYELLTGELPYGEITPEHAEKKQFMYQSALKYNKNIPEWIDAALEKAVQPVPEKRYQLLSEFVADLSHPNNSLVQERAFKPLIERNPLKFWRYLALIEGLLLFSLLILMAI